MSRARRSGGVAANPFVVFADLTTALAFIFALCSIALSKALSDVTRDVRQTSVKDSFVGQVRRLYPSVTVSPAPWAETDYDRRRNVILADQKKELGRLLTNGSYQRLALDAAFAFGSKVPLPEYRSVYTSIGELVKTQMNAGKISYVYFHGVVEEGEAGPSGSEEARALAESRARAMYDSWNAAGLIAPKPGLNDGRIDPRFVVAYGKAGLYKQVPYGTNPDRVPGRVDIVLFFSDHE